MTSVTPATPNRSTTHFRKDSDMFPNDLRLAQALERQALLRASRDADRRAEGSARSLRHRLGSSLIAMGRRIGGETVNAPAWQG